MADDRISIFKSLDLENAKKDSKHFFKILKSILVFYVKERYTGPFKVIRDSKAKDISKVVLPPELKTEFNDVEINEAIDDNFKNIVENFAKVLTDNIPQKDLTNFYNNINTIKIGHPEEANFDPKTTSFFDYAAKLSSKINDDNNAGTYSVVGNVIALNDIEKLDAINHELLHLASGISATEEDDTYYGGFAQKYYSLKDGMVVIGEGLNEGYTELLNRRLFPGEHGGTVSYEMVLSLAGKVEEIVGKDKMQSLYFNADLKGLIDSLKEYASEKEIMDFIANTDFLLNYFGNDNNKNVASKLSLDALDKSVDFLINCEQKKAIKEYQDGKYEDVNDMFREIVRFCTEFGGVDYSNIISKMDGYRDKVGAPLRYGIATLNGNRMSLGVLEKMSEVLSGDGLKELVHSTFEKMEQVGISKEEATMKK
jgi:hypothetical protein